MIVCIYKIITFFIKDKNVLLVFLTNDSCSTPGMCIKVSRVSFDFTLTSNLQPVGFYLFIFVDLLSVFQFQGNLQT